MCILMIYHLEIMNLSHPIDDDVFLGKHQYCLSFVFTFLIYLFWNTYNEYGGGERSVELRK